MFVERQAPLGGGGGGGGGGGRGRGRGEEEEEDMGKGRSAAGVVLATSLLAATAGTSIAQSEPIEIPAPGPELCGGQEWNIGFANLIRNISFTIDVEESIQRAADATGCIELTIM